MHNDYRNCAGQIVATNDVLAAKFGREMVIFTDCGIVGKYSFLRMITRPTLL